MTFDATDPDTMEALGAAYAVGYGHGAAGIPSANPWPHLIGLEDPTQGLPFDDPKKALNREKAEIGTAGIYLSHLALRNLGGDVEQPVVLTDEEDDGWWFYLPETWPNEEWRGDIRWFKKEGARFIPDIGVEPSPHPFRRLDAPGKEYDVDDCAMCGLPKMFHVHDDPHAGQDFDWGHTDMPPEEYMPVDLDDERDMRL
jgi:hypothetical protein